MQFFKDVRVTLATPFDKATCLSKLQLLIDASWFESIQRRSLSGRIQGDRFWIRSKYEAGVVMREHRFRRRGLYPFSPVQGRISVVENGCKIEVKLLNSFRLFHAVVVVLFALVPLLLLCISSFAMLMRWVEFRPVIIGSWIGTLFLCMVVAVSFSVRDGFIRSEQQFILDELCKALDGKVV